MQYIRWLQHVPQGHLFHTLCHESQSSHVLLTRFQIFHIKYWASQFTCRSHLGLGLQGRKSLHLKSNLKIALMFFKHSSPLSWANSTNAVMPKDSKSQVVGHDEPSLLQVSAASTFAVLSGLSENALQQSELLAVVNLRWKNAILGISGSPCLK